MSLTPGSPAEISVIVAAQNADATIEESLSSLEEQNDRGVAEIIVVDNSQNGTAELVGNRFPSARVIKVAEPKLIPQLWAIGAQAARGRIIAFTTAHFVLDKRWIAETLHHHQSNYAAVGGTIENTESASPAQWAVYFCRYYRYMLPFTQHLVRQVPGDNASYKRWVLEEYPDLIEDGFWETNVNNQLFDDGHALLLTPTIRVDQLGSCGAWAFCKQRLIHGRRFGRERRASASDIRRLLYVVSSPLIPLIILGKIFKEVFKKKRHRAALFISLPSLILFVLSWSAGESLGYLFGGSANSA